MGEVRSSSLYLLISTHYILTEHQNRFSHLTIVLGKIPPLVAGNDHRWSRGSTVQIQPHFMICCESLFCFRFLICKFVLRDYLSQFCSSNSELFCRPIGAEKNNSMDYYAS